MMSSKIDDDLSTAEEEEEDIKVSDRSRRVPYILNGVFYEIESRNGENVTVRCCNCPPDRVYRGSVRSTGNFHMHIKRRHPNLADKLNEMKIASLLQRRKRQRNIPKNHIQTNDSKNVDEKRELKIKTVFKRHKREKQQQGESLKNEQLEAASDQQIQLSLTALSDENVEINTENAQAANNTSIVTVRSHQPVPKIHACEQPKPAHASSLVGVNLNYTAIDLSYLPQQPNTALAHLESSGKGLHPLETIKPEQPIDLTINNHLSTSLTQNTITDIENRASTFDFNEIMRRIDSRLYDLQQALHMSNQINSNSMLLQLAMFKYEHPDFHHQFQV